MMNLDCSALKWYRSNHATMKYFVQRFTVTHSHTTPAVKFRCAVLFKCGTRRSVGRLQVKPNARCMPCRHIATHTHHVYMCIGTIGTTLYAHARLISYGYAHEPCASFSKIYGLMIITI